MASKRNGILKLTDYFESLGIIVNIGKNKARGNKGLFITKGGKNFRIDVSRKINESEILSIMLHEFAHYIHYMYDSSLCSLDFVFGDITDDELEELLKITVEKVPKDAANILYNKKNEFNQKIKFFSEYIKRYYPDFKLSKSYRAIEKSIKYPARYLLKHDRVSFLNKVYSVERLENDFDNLSECQCAYIRIKSLQRCIARINARINKLNKYYNKPAELWARFCELYFTDFAKAEQLAPLLTVKFRNILKSKKIKELSDVNEILQMIL